jgi:hypothetical protein
MTPRKRKSRVYWREQGGTRRAWFDGRDYRDVGGVREPLVAPGERFATTDSDVAGKLAAERLAELETARRRRAFHGGRAVESRLAAFARLHLIAKKKAGKVTDTWLASAQLLLERAVVYFGAERELDTIRVSDPGLGRTFGCAKNAGGSAPQLGHHSAPSQRPLEPLSAGSRGRSGAARVQPGGRADGEAGADAPRGQWLELHDASILLLAARALPVRAGTKLDAEAIAGIRAAWASGKTSKVALARAHRVSNVWISRILEGQDATSPIDEASLAYPLIATYLLTGGRETEVLGLELDDVSLDRRTVTFRPNTWRRLKTPGSHRVVRLWPQLAGILGPYIAWRTVQRGGRLLFPSPWAMSR